MGGWGVGVALRRNPAHAARFSAFWLQVQEAIKDELAELPPPPAGILGTREGVGREAGGREGGES